MARVTNERTHMENEVSISDLMAALENPPAGILEKIDRRISGMEASLSSFKEERPGTSR